MKSVDEINPCCEGKSQPHQPTIKIGVDQVQRNFSGRIGEFLMFNPLSADNNIDAQHNEDQDKGKK